MNQMINNVLPRADGANAATRPTLAPVSDPVLRHAMRIALEARHLAAELVAAGTGRELGLNIEDLATLGVARLQELKINAVSAREFDGYNLNEPTPPAS